MNKLRQQLVDATKDPRYFAEALELIPDDIKQLSGELVGAFLYVLKGAKPMTVEGEALKDLAISENGLMTSDGKLRDREMTIVMEKSGKSGGQDYTHVALQQVLEPRIELIAPDYDGKGNLKLSAKSFGKTENVQVDELQPGQGEKIKIGIKQEGAFEGVLLPDKLPIVEWVKAFLSDGNSDYDPQTIGIVVRPADYRREVSGAIGDDQGKTTLYSDGGQMTVASLEDLNWLNGHNSGRNIDMSAFRMNLILKGFPAHALGLIHELRINGQDAIAEILVTTLCVRCAATQVISETGRRGDKEHLSWLDKYAPHRPNNLKSAPTFGSNAVSVNDGVRVSVSDRVSVSSEKEPYQQDAQAFPY